MHRRIVILLVLVFVLVSCNYPVPTETLPADRSVPPEDTVPLPLDGTRQPLTTPSVDGTKLPTLLAPTPGSTGAISESLSNTDSGRFYFQSGSPLGVGNFVAPEAGCNWTGVGGQVFGKEGLPITGLVVEVSGALDGKKVFGLALTGGSPQLGPGGYFLRLADRAVASDRTLTIRLLDISGKPLSDTLAFNTYAECERNLILINFTISNSTFFPVIYR